MDKKIQNILAEILLRLQKIETASDIREAVPAVAILLTLRQVESTVGFKKSKIYSMIEESTFPAPLRIGPKAVRWKMADVESWVRALSSKQMEAV